MRRKIITTKKPLIHFFGGSDNILLDKKEKLPCIFEIRREFLNGNLTKPRGFFAKNYIEVTVYDKSIKYKPHGMTECFVSEGRMKVFLNKFSFETAQDVCGYFNRKLPITFYIYEGKTWNSGNIK